MKDSSNPFSFAGNHEIKRCLAKDFLWFVPQQISDSGTGVDVDASLIYLPDPVADGLNQGPELVLAPPQIRLRSLSLADVTRNT
jgi:hypothetical protein